MRFWTREQSVRNAHCSLDRIPRFSNGSTVYRNVSICVDEEWTERFDTLNFSTRISFNFSGVFNFEITEMKFLRNHSLDKYQSNFATVLFP